MARPRPIAVASAAYFAGLASVFAGVFFASRDGGFPTPWIIAGGCLIVVGVLVGSRAGRDAPRR